MSTPAVGSLRPALVLFRQDLRLDDNHALEAAVATGRPVIPVFVFDELTPGTRAPGGARRWWLHHSLLRLDAALARIGSRLVIRAGAMADVVLTLCRETGAAAVFWNRRYELAAREADADMKARLLHDGIQAGSHAGFLLHEPFRVKTTSGGPFRVFTPFWRAVEAGDPPRRPIDPPDALIAPSSWPRSLAPEALCLLPKKPDWSGGLAQAWVPGEDGARAALADFVAHGLAGYAARRDRPDVPSTSRLSPYLAHGEISPARIHAAIEAAAAAPADKAKFLSEVGWREFSWHLLFHFPQLATRNFNPAFDAFPWRQDRTALDAWTQGRTGFPLVDAGMRQLWTTGWMHNRVRMVAASFLTKHLLIDWRLGEAWFWDTLVDADPASNAASWQWVAGSGADAAPYFRIFNPATQALKFDPDGAYVQRHLPGPNATPIVAHDVARARALAAFETMRRGAV